MTNVLVVEDNKLNMDLMFEILQLENIKFEGAWNGKEAIKKANKKTFDLVLMDIKLSGMDGVQVKNKLKMMPQYKDVPILAVTALSMKGDKDKYLNEGFDDYISKPFNLSEFTQKISEYLSGTAHTNSIPIAKYCEEIPQLSF